MLGLCFKILSFIINMDSKTLKRARKRIFGFAGQWNHVSESPNPILCLNFLKMRFGLASNLSQLSATTSFITSPVACIPCCLSCLSQSSLCVHLLWAFYTTIMHECRAQQASGRWCPVSQDKTHILISVKKKIVEVFILMGPSYMLLTFFFF